jgi:hypothetical protein
MSLISIFRELISLSECLDKLSITQKLNQKTEIIVMNLLKLKRPYI